MDNPTAVAFNLITSSIAVVNISLARFFPTTLVPPETLNITGLLNVGSIAAEFGAPIGFYHFCA